MSTSYRPEIIRRPKTMKPKWKSRTIPIVPIYENSRTRAQLATGGTMKGIKR